MWKLKLGPWEYKLVRSDFQDVGGSRLMYVARVFSYTRRRASIGEADISCQGQRVASVQPMAVIADQRGVRRLIPVVDATSLLMWALAGICVTSFLAARAVSRSLDRPADLDS